MTELGDGRGSTANNLKLQLEVSNSLGFEAFLAALLIAQKHDDFLFLFFFKYAYYMPGVPENKLQVSLKLQPKTSALREILNVWKEFALVVFLRFLSL